MTPFEAVFGRPPPSLTDYLAGDSTNASVDDLLIERATVLQELKKNLSRAQLRMKNQANAGRTDVQFQKDDWVLLKLQPYRQTSLRQRSFNKLARRFYGPFQILERIGAVAYRLNLPDTAKLHNVFHISRLKKFIGDPTMEVNPLPAEFLNQHPVLTPSNVLQSREILRKGKVIPQILVQWGQHPKEEATWEDTAEFQKMFPEFTLEDKGVVEVETIDANAITGDKLTDRRRSGRRNQGIGGDKYKDFVMN